MRNVFCAAVLLAIVPCGAYAAHGKNAVADHPSPYLALHGGDPVHWQPWGSEAIERARREDKLLYVSIGYFSCHWCHVMQRESYKNPEIAAILNAGFIPVKVDRELQPALDKHLIDFVQMTRGHAGWPLNVFVTPEGHPLAGMTYQPANLFKEFVVKLGERWDAEKIQLKKIAAEGARLMRDRTPPTSGRKLSAAKIQQYREDFIAQVFQVADELAGGFGDTSKFPQTPQLSTLLRAHRDRPDPKIEKFLRLTLSQMADKGLRDHLAGGFFRYATDPAWEVPHFEKMLYGNALLAELYLDASIALDAPFMETVARQTLDFMLSELWEPPGAFIASLSSIDDKDVEGGYYLWDEDTLARSLSDDELAVIRLAWGVDGPAPLDAGHLPLQAMAPADVARELEITPSAVTQRLDSTREKLLRVRAQRKLPRDFKLLAAWNGLALSALARGARLDGGERYRDAARRLRDYLVDSLWDGARLLRAKDASGEFGAASLEDYAYVARGLLAWADLTKSESDYRLAQKIVEQAWRRFHSETGWRLAEDILIDFGNSEPVIADGPMPSPSAVLLRATLEVAAELDDSRLSKLARETLSWDMEMLGAAPYLYATHIAVLAEHAPRAEGE